MAKTKMPVFLKAWLAQFLGFGLGATLGWFIYPATGGFGDAFRPHLILVAGIIGIFLSSIYAAWLCCRG